MINELTGSLPNGVAPGGFAQAASQLVPAAFAEKAMASVMQLHAELMDEKERRVDLFRKLMDREQALAELKMYVRVLEEKLAPPPPPVAVAPPIVVPQPQPIHVRPPPPPKQTPPVPPPMPPRVTTTARLDGWKTW
ncbi:MAG: hypothetical protein JNM17_16905 [Archangium sp.]|nr:hypothetical protein [Archangium sp.]